MHPSSLPRSFQDVRPYSPVPPPCPSPQLIVRPLPTPPAHRRPSSSHEQQPLSPRRRPRFVSAHPALSAPPALSVKITNATSTIPGPPRRASAPTLPFPQSIPRRSSSPSLPIPPTSPRKHRRSDSSVGTSPPSPGYVARSLARARTRSPTRGPSSIPVAKAPPVPPLPPSATGPKPILRRERERETKKSRPIPIRIPELGLNFGFGRSVRKQRSVANETSFLKLDPKRTDMLDDNAGCLRLNLRAASQSSPDVTTKPRSLSASTPTSPFLGRRLMRTGLGHAAV